jgi:hypothetical protein
MQSDVIYLQHCCMANHMKLNGYKTKVSLICSLTSASFITLLLSLQVVLNTLLFSWLQTVLSSSCWPLILSCHTVIRPNRAILISFCSLDNLLMLYISLVRRKHEFASVVWNSLTNTKYNVPRESFLPYVAKDSLQIIIYAVTIFKIAFSWDVASCRSCVNRRSGGMYRLHLRSRKIRERGTSVSRWLAVSTSSRPAVGPIQPPIQWVPGVLSSGVKRPGREAHHSPPTSSEVKKIWIYTSTPPYAFMA